MSKSLVTVSDSLSGLENLLPADRRVIAVTDRNIGRLYHNLIPTRERIFIDAAENLKTLETVSCITKRLLEMEADRNVFLLGIGGGITTDITGFTASVYKRGVQFAFVPTTLLAMVDASIGGKNGVNHDGFKNIIGTFTMPAFTWCWTGFLESLPPREFRCGAAELLKTLMIGDAAAYEDTVELLSSGGPAKVSERMLRTAVDIKEDIVRRDFRDTGERMKLNLGHTFGHAVEKCAFESGLDVSHGEAVAMGMVLAARLSEKMGYAPPGLSLRIERDFEKAGLRAGTPFPVRMLQAVLRNDKKRDGDRMNFVFIRDIGSVVVDQVKIEDIRL